MFKEISKTIICPCDSVPKDIFKTKHKSYKAKNFQENPCKGNVMKSEEIYIRL